MFELIKYEFVRNAFAAGILAGVVCGIVGALVVSKRIVSLCGGISHAAFGGIGLGYLLKINPGWGALAFGLLSGLGIGYVSKKSKQHEDTLIGIFWAVGMSLGILFIGASRGYVPDLFTYLFGNILTVTRADLLGLLLLDIFAVAAMVILYRPILAVCFDEEYSATRGIPANGLYLFLLVLVALTVVVLMKIVGSILVIAMLTLPAAAASRFSSSLKGMIVRSVVLCWVFVMLGLIISYYSDMPSGATIVLVGGAGFALINWLKNSKFKSQKAKA